jgi:hypothetical protein
MIAAFALILAAIGVASTGFGVDSRDGSDDPHRSSYPVGIS